MSEKSSGRGGNAVTPRHPSGSRMVSDARRACLEVLADKLTRISREKGIRLERPDLLHARLAHQARELAARFASWHQPGGRKTDEERGQDGKDYRELVARAAELGVHITG